FFVNNLVMRTDISGDPSFAELVKRVRAFALEAYAHEDIPFERLVDALQPARSLARHPLFQVMLVLQNTPRVSLDPRWSPMDVEPLLHRLAKYDLSFSLREQLAPSGEPQGVSGYMEYSLDLFDRGEIGRAHV